MKRSVHICLFLFFTLSGYILPAQLSPAFYQSLPPELKPGNQQRPTISESIALLGLAGNYGTMQYQSEWQQLASDMAEVVDTIGDTLLKAKTYYALGVYYYNLSAEKTAAFNYFQQVLLLSASSKNLEQEHYFSNFYIAVIYSYWGRQDSAIRYTHASFDARQTGSNPGMMRRVYDTYSRIYSSLGLYQQSIGCNKMLMSLIPSQDRWNLFYTKAMLRNIDNYILLYDQTHKSVYADTAEMLINEIFINQQEHAREWFGAGYFYKGYLNYILKDFSQARIFFDSSLLPTYNDGDVYFKNTADKMFYKALTLIVQGNYKSGYAMLLPLNLGNNFVQLREMNRVLYEHAKTAQNWKAAQEYYEKYTGYYDSVNIVLQRGIVFEAEQKYAFAEKQQQITDLKNNNLVRQKEKDRLIGISIMLSLLLLVIIAILYALFKRSQYRRIAEKQKLQEELIRMENDMNNERTMQYALQQQEIEEQRKMISNDLHDGINSGLAALKFYIADIRGKVKDPEMKQQLGNVEDEAQALYMHARDFMNNLNKEKIVINHDVIFFLKNIEKRFSTAGAFNITVSIDEEGIDYYFTKEQHAALYLIFKEAITNTFKHAAATALHISIGFKANNCIFSIKDNGRGFEKKAAKKGLGLQSVSARAAALKGFIELSSDNSGTFIYGNFPVQEQ